MGHLTFQPLISGSSWLILAMAALGMMIWYLPRPPGGISRRRWLLIISLMGTAIALVLALLLNPTWVHEIDTSPGKPVLTILVDGGRSMGTADEANGRTRYLAAVGYAGQLSQDLSNDFDVHLAEFDSISRATDSATLAAASPTGRSTDLAGAVSSALETGQSQAIVMLSDGIQRAPGGAARVLQSARLARSLESPVYTHTFGQVISQANIGIDLKSAQDVALVGQTVPLSAMITHQGLTSGSTTVTLLQDGAEVEHRDVLLDSTGPSQVNFLLWHDKPGIYTYDVRVQPLPGQTSLESTTAGYALRVVDEPIRVLLLEGKPYWDSKFFVRTLAADPAVALVAITRLSDSRIVCRTLSHARPRTNSGAATQPDSAGDMIDTWKLMSDAREPLSTIDKLEGYQIIVLGRDVEAFLDDNAIANLQSWVSQQGGSLVCYRGDPTQQTDARLKKLLPVDWSPAPSPTRFRIALTTEGRDLNWLAGESDDPLPRLPSLSASDTIGVSKPLAVVLASAMAADGTTTPVVVYHPYGMGRVVAVQGAGMWRWAFLPPEYQDQETAYANLWQSMLRWLTSGDKLHPGQTDCLRADRVRFTTEEAATATLLVRDVGKGLKIPAIELWAGHDRAQGAAERTFSATPIGAQAGAYRVDFGKLPPGRYAANISGRPADDIAAKVVFDVVDYDQETIDLEARPDLMSRIAEDSGGAVLGDDASKDLTENFKQAFAREHPPRRELASVWDRWWLLAGALALWMISWSVRRSGGLV